MIGQHEALIELEKNLNQLVRTSLGRRAFLMSLPILLASCASRPRHRHREGDNSGQQTFLTVADEKRMAREYLPKMQKEYPRHKSVTAQRYVTNLGNHLATSSKLQVNPYTYQFSVVESKQVNAFALPAGHIFVTAPLIKAAKSEAELAGVIGHEIGHVKARHTAERIDKAKKEESRSLIYGAIGGVLGGVAGFGLGKALCRKNDRRCLEKAALYGLSAGATGGLLVQKFAFMANSREDEMEADRIGFRVAHRAGYHKDHIGLFYTRLLEMEKQYRKKSKKFLAPLVDAMSTHPPSQERVAQMQEMALQAGQMGKKIDSREFRRLQRLV